MSSVTFDPTVGGDGSTVTDDTNPTTGLGAGGHRARFVPALAQTVAVAAHTVTQAELATTKAGEAATAKNEAVTARNEAVAARDTAVTTTIPALVAQVDTDRVNAQAAIAADVTAVDDARIAAQSDIAADVAAVEAAKNTAINEQIPARVALVDEAVAATYVGQAGASATAAAASATAAADSAAQAAGAADDLRDDLAAPGGSALVGYQAGGAGAVPRMVQGKLRELWVSVADYGALGNGLGIDRSAIQAAIDYVFSLGGGTVYFPMPSSFYRITTPLILRPGVSLLGDPRRPRIINTTSSGGVGVQEVLLPGNFHPDFTEDLPYKDCGSIFPGYTVTLTNPADATGFTVGEQVFVAANTGTVTAGFMVPTYGFLNIIESISGATLTLREPIDAAFAGKIARLAGSNGRNGTPLFFAQDSMVADLHLESTGYTYMNDSATLNVFFQRLTTVGTTAIYGNTFQRTKWLDCDMYWHSIIGEQSHNSLHSKAERCRFIFKPRVGSTPNLGISIQEYARGIEYINCEYDFGPLITSGEIFRTINAQDVKFKGGKVIISSPTYGSNIVSILTSGALEFPAKNCVVEDVDFHIVNCGRYVWIDGRANAGNTENGVRNCKFFGPASVSDSIRLTGSTGNFVQNNDFPSGALQFSGSNFLNVIEENYIGNGFSAQTGADETGFQNNFIRRNRSAASVAKQVVRRSISSDINVVAGATVDIYDANVGTKVLLRDKFEFELLLTAGGNNGDRTVRFHILDATASTDTTVFSIVIPAAEPGRHNIRAYLYFQATHLVYAWTRINEAGFATHGTNRITTPNRSNNLSIQIEAAVAGTNTSLAVQHLGADCLNPWFG